MASLGSIVLHWSPLAASLQSSSNYSSVLNQVTARWNEEEDDDDDEDDRAEYGCFSHDGLLRHSLLFIPNGRSHCSLLKKLNLKTVVLPWTMIKYPATLQSYSTVRNTTTPWLNNPLDKNNNIRTLHYSINNTLHWNSRNTPALHYNTDLPLNDLLPDTLH